MYVHLRRDAAKTCLMLTMNYSESNLSVNIPTPVFNLLCSPCALIKNVEVKSDCGMQSAKGSLRYFENGVLASPLLVHKGVNCYRKFQAK